MDNEVKFKCPKCSTKIGEIVFSGKKCNCGEWVTPAFQVHKNKVDCIKKII
jgi:dual specificity phosphatase 12